MKLSDVNNPSIELAVMNVLRNIAGRGYISVPASTHLAIADMLSEAGYIKYVKSIGKTKLTETGESWLKSLEAKRDAIAAMPKSMREGSIVVDGKVYKPWNDAHAEHLKSMGVPHDEGYQPLNELPMEELIKRGALPELNVGKFPYGANGKVGPFKTFDEMRSEACKAEAAEMKAPPSFPKLSLDTLRRINTLMQDRDALLDQLATIEMELEDLNVEIK